MNPFTSRAAAAVVAAYLLAGCGNAALSGTDLAATGLAADGAAGLRGMAGGKGGFGGQKGGHGGERGHKGGAMGLYGLTDEQKTQIQAIEAKYRPARPTGERPADPVKDLLAAETLDVEALKAALAARDAAKPDRPDHAAPLAEIRAVLTDAQRAAIVAKLEAMPAPQAPDAAAPADRPAPPTVDERVAKVAEKLALTDAQKAAFVAFETAMEANRPTGDKPQADHAARHAAMIAFWKTGETAGLEAAKPAAADRPAFPVDAFVALAQALSAEQRVQLLSRGPGGHGGPRAGAMGHKGGHGATTVVSARKLGDGVLMAW